MDDFLVVSTNRKCLSQLFIVFGTKWLRVKLYLIWSRKIIVTEETFI